MFQVCCELVCVFYSTCRDSYDLYPGFVQTSDSIQAYQDTSCKCPGDTRVLCLWIQTGIFSNPLYVSQCSLNRWELPDFKNRLLSTDLVHNRALELNQDMFGYYRAACKIQYYKRWHDKDYQDCLSGQVKGKSLRYGLLLQYGIHPVVTTYQHCILA